MYLFGGKLVFSPSDLITFMDSDYASAMERLKLEDSSIAIWSNQIVYMLDNHNFLNDIFDSRFIAFQILSKISICDPYVTQVPHSMVVWCYHFINHCFY